MGGEATFGPKETKETLLFQMLKKQQDTAKIREELESQMAAKQMNEDLGHKKTIYMDNSNIKRAQFELSV